MKEAILNRPWLIILVGYLFAMGAWIAMVTIAVNHGDKPIPVVTSHR